MTALDHTVLVHKRNNHIKDVVSFFGKMRPLRQNKIDQNNIAVPTKIESVETYQHIAKKSRRPQDT